MRSDLFVENILSSIISISYCPSKDKSKRKAKQETIVMLTCISV